MVRKPVFIILLLLSAQSAFAQDPQDTDQLAFEAHKALFSDSKFPSAKACRVCHKSQYRQWSVSQHAYAQLSPVFMAMHNTTNKENSSTNGDFCIRCHNPIGMSLKESLFAASDEAQGDLNINEPDYLPSLKFAEMGNIPWGYIGLGYRVAIAYGISGDKDVVFINTTIDGFYFEGL